MKKCPKCGREFEDANTLCPADGTVLAKTDDALIGQTLADKYRIECVLAKSDQPSGSNDDSFGKGTAEDNPNPTIVTGSIPPNKSDLKVFGVNTEIFLSSASGRRCAGAGFKMMVVRLRSARSVAA